MLILIIEKEKESNEKKEEEEEEKETFPVYFQKYIEHLIPELTFRFEF